MNILYYNTICPKSRFSRILLKEYNKEFKIKNEEFWLYRDNFLKINPSGDLPIFIAKNDNQTYVTSGIYPLIEYLYHQYPNNHLWSKDINICAEIRRLVDWNNNKFFHEVISPIINEKIICFYLKTNSPNSNIIRQAKQNLISHLNYIKFLLNNNDWIAHHSISIADLAFASSISILDYLGEINWKENTEVKNWYILIKSRPSMKEILEEKINGFTPNPTYNKLDL